MQTLTKLKDEALKKAPAGGGPAQGTSEARRAPRAVVDDHVGRFRRLRERDRPQAGRAQAQEGRRSRRRRRRDGGGRRGRAAREEEEPRRRRPSARPPTRRRSRRPTRPRPTARRRAARAQRQRSLRLSQEVTSTIEIDAPASRVWSVLMDPARLGDWVSAHRDVDWDGGELAEGDSFTQTLRLGGAKTKIDWTVVELDEPKRAVWTGRGPVTLGGERRLRALRERRDDDVRLHEQLRPAGRRGGAPRRAGSRRRPRGRPRPRRASTR